jgi:hypothetical protein
MKLPFLNWFRNSPNQSPAPHLVIPLDANRPSGTLVSTSQPSVNQKETHTMFNLNFKNVGHALATFFKTAAADAKKIAVAADADIQKVEADKTKIEAVSAGVAAAVAPGSETAVISVEDAAFAVLGSIDAAIKDGGAAAEQKLLDAGLDSTAIAAVKAVGTASQTFYSVVKSANATA